MKKYYATHLVKSEDLNHHGTLFAARTASWFVESAFIAAACEHGDPSEIVCRNIHGMSFRVVHTGSTSLMVHVEVSDELTGQLAVDGYLTFVTVYKETGEKHPHGIVLDEPEDAHEVAEREGAQRLRAGL